MKRVVAAVLLAVGLSAYAPLPGRATTTSTVPAVPDGPVFEAASFGATGNDATDDRTAIQNALNAAVGTGGTVHLSPGTYMLSKWLVYGSNVTLSGDGGNTTIRNLTSRNPADTLMLRPNGAGISNFTVRNLTWDARRDYFDQSGYRIDQIAIDLSQTTNSTVQDSHFKNIRTAGIYGYGDAAFPITNLRVLRNHVFDASGDGITFFGKMNGMLIDSNTVEHTQDDAIAIQDASSTTGQPVNTTISNNVVRDSNVRCPIGCTPAGIRVFGAAHTLVVNNSTTNTFMSGIAVTSGATHRATHTTLHNNRITGAGSNNTTTDVPRSSILIYRADHLFLSGNVISANAQGAPDTYVYDSSETFRFDE